MTAAPFPDEVRDRVTSYIQHQGTKSPSAIVDLVRTSQERYLETIGALEDDVADRKPSPDEWSVRELTRHVIDAQEHVSELVRLLALGKQPEDRSGAGRMVEDDGRPFAQYVDDLRDLNARMLQAIGRLPDAPNLEETAPHPFFGPLNCKEWAAFQRVHDEDHVQHAQKILVAVV
jgi:hypothetical protein